MPEVRPPQADDATTPGADGFVSATGRTVTLPGGRLLAWDEHGRPGDPVVLVVDDAGRVRTSEEIEAARRRGIRLLAIDRPGSGGSSPAPGAGPEDWPADVAALADHLGIREFSVVGAGDALPYAHAVVRQLADRVVHAELAVPGAAGEMAASPVAGPPDAVPAADSTGLVAAATGPVATTTAPVGALPPIVAVERPPRTLAAGLVIAGGAVALTAAAVIAGVLLAGPAPDPGPEPGPDFRPGALDALPEVPSPPELGEVRDAPAPAGGSGTAGRLTDAAAGMIAGTSPAACVRFAFAEPLDRTDGERTDRVLAVADVVAEDASSLTAYARAFPSAEDAIAWVEATAARIDRCAGGYGSTSWSAASIDPLDLADTGIRRDGVGAVAWVERGENATGERYVLHGAELRRGSVVVRATCTLVQRPDPVPCFEWWSAIADRLEAIPASAER